MSASNPNEETLLYPMAKRRKSSVVDDCLPPLSGLYEGKLDGDENAKANLEVKMDIDRIKKYSPFLNIVSGSIVKSSGLFSKLTEAQGLYFRSIRKSVKINRDVPGAANNETEVSCDMLVIGNDGNKFIGKFHCLLRLPQDEGVWRGDATIQLGSERVTFEDINRTSSYFRRVTVDIDYVDEVVWPTISLSNFDNVPGNMKERNLDPAVAFEDAGVELVYKEENSNKVEDPNPHNPWTKLEMYDVMIANFDYADNNIDTLWCMIATKPPDERFMGFSFQHRSHHGFGLFTGHKSFDGLLDRSSENFIHSSRRFLHYFMHECGHGLGLHHPFEIGKPNDLTWMNYAWKYDVVHGPGEFYQDFRYSFTDSELCVIRHSPSRAFNNVKLPSVQISDYGRVKSLPSGKNLEDDDIDNEEEAPTISLRIKLRPEPYTIGELVELEIRIRNESETTILVEQNLSPKDGNLVLFVTSPEGSIQRVGSVVSPICSSSHVNPLLLHPFGGDEGSDRFSELIRVGEEKIGSTFCHEGRYNIQAVYTSGQYNATSNSVECNIIASDATDAACQSTMNTALCLGGLNKNAFNSVVNEWKKVTLLPTEQKRLKLCKLISIADDRKTDVVRSTQGGARAEKSSKKKVVQVQPARLSKEEFLEGTEDLVQYYQQKGKKDDNMQYKELILARAKILLKTDVAEATSEFNQLLADLVRRGLKYAGLKSVSEEWNNLKATDVKEDQMLPKNLQARVEEILDWYPAKQVKKETDLSGIGLGTLLSHFRDDHVFATSKIVLHLFNKLDETNDLNVVFDYADNLQRGYQVNHQVLQWAVEIFIIHCELAKKSGIEYPLPKPKDTSIGMLAAMTITQRTGTPRESWMHYWRMDADLNYHHRHWHSVYVVGREIGSNINWFGRWRQARPELERQGELFTYMHSQMLARYNAERTTWGLNQVQEWDYDDTDTEGFNAGFEFHNDPQNASMAPRPPASWPLNARSMFREWERNYQAAVDSGELPPVRVAGRSQLLRFPMDFNLSGHVLEASSSTWQRSLGNIHNSGHVVFGTNRVPGDGSYMLSTVTAMRDPIFYRWHKHIDDLWQRWNQTQVIEVGDDAPPVLVEQNDIIMSRSETPLENFESFGSDVYVSDKMTTYLGPPQKKFEFDNKKSHDPFYYHLRFRRTAPGDLNLTFRIFICQASQINIRTMWIEMDKFVYRLARDQNSAVIIRPDRHSSVIKRIPREMEGNVETSTTNMVNGFCECGWPYNMLLPRGTSSGEDYRLCVFVSDNNQDRIGVRSSCGSLSFCGASGQQYPDRRPMGYPFTTDISVRGRQMSIPEAITSLSNAAISSFIIKNNVSENPSSPMFSIWSPWDQLQQDDGTRQRSSEVTSYRTSRLVGRMRVLIDDQAMSFSNQTGRLSVRFQGRGDGNGSYRVGSVTVSQRNGTTLNVNRQSPVADVTVNGQRTFDVPPQGIICDESEISPGGEDIFVTFTLESPGSYLRGGRNQPTNTWVISNPSGEAETTEDWDGLDNADINVSSSIYCVGGMMAPLPR